MLSPLHGRKSDVFVYGYYGCGNLGDEMLLSAVVSGILQRWPDARFRVRNLGAITPERRLAERITPTGIESILLAPGRTRAAKAIAYLRAADRELRACRYLVLGGGTLIHAKTSLASLGLLSALVVMARLRGLEVVGLGLGVNRLEHPLARGLARLMQALMADLVVRDKASRQALGSTGKLRLAADLVYDWWPRTIALPPPALKPVIAISLWSIPPAYEAALIEALARALKSRADAGNVIRCLVMQDGDALTGGPSDRVAIGRLADRLARYGVDCEVVRPETEPTAIASAFSGVIAHCGARFHAAVAATLLGVPSVGLATDAKVSSLCAEFQLPCLEVEAGRLVDVSEVAAAIEQATACQIDVSKLEELRRRSALNFSWFDARRDQARVCGDTEVLTRSGAR